MVTQSAARSPSPRPPRHQVSARPPPLRRSPQSPPLPMGPGNQLLSGGSWPSASWSSCRWWCSSPPEDPAPPPMTSGTPSDDHASGDRDAVLLLRPQTCGTPPSGVDMTLSLIAVPRPQKLPLILAAIAVVAVVIPAGLLGGAFAAPVAGLPDVGALVHWGLPIVRAIHDLAAATTIGLLVVAATIIPEARHTCRRITAARYACASGIVWVVAGLVGLMFSFADLAGTPLSDPTFGNQFQTFLFQLDFTRVAAISSAMALVVTIGAAVVRRRSGMVALAALSILAMLPLSLAGHASGAANHDIAVNSLALHLISSVLWVGGLLALAMLRPLLGTAPVSYT